MKVEKFFYLLLFLASIIEAKKYNKRKLAIHFGRKLSISIEHLLRQFGYSATGKDVLHHYYVSSLLSVSRAFFTKIDSYSQAFWSKFAQMSNLSKPGAMVFHMRTFLKIVQKQRIQNKKSITLMLSKYADSLKMAGMLTTSEKSYFVHSMLQILEKYEYFRKGRNQIDLFMQRYQEEACENILDELNSKTTFEVSKNVIKKYKLNLPKILSKYTDYSAFKLPRQHMAKLFLESNYKSEGIGMKKLAGIVAKTRDYYIKKIIRSQEHFFQSHKTENIYARFIKNVSGDMTISKEKTVHIKDILADQLALSFAKIFKEQKFFSVQHVHKTFDKYAQLYNGHFLKAPPHKMQIISNIIKRNFLTLEKKNRDKLIKRQKEFIITQQHLHHKVKVISQIYNSSRIFNKNKIHFAQSLSKIKDSLMQQTAVHHTSKVMFYNIKNFNKTQNTHIKKSINRIREVLILQKSNKFSAKSIQNLKKNIFYKKGLHFAQFMSRVKEIPLQKQSVHLVAKSIAKAVDKKQFSQKELHKCLKQIERQKDFVLRSSGKSFVSINKSELTNKKSLKLKKFLNQVGDLKKIKEFKIFKKKINFISKSIYELKKQIESYQKIETAENFSRLKELQIQAKQAHLQGMLQHKMRDKKAISEKQLRKYLKSINRQKETLIKLVGPLNFKAKSISTFKEGVNIFFNLKNNQAQSFDRLNEYNLKAVKGNLISKIAEKLTQQIHQSSKQQHKKNISRIKEILLKVHKQNFKSKCIQELSKKSSFSGWEIKKAINSLQKIKENLLHKNLSKNFKAKLNENQYKKQQLSLRLQSNLELDRNKEIDYISQVIKKVYKSMVKSQRNQNQNLTQLQTIQLRKDLSSFKEHYLNKGNGKKKLISIFKHSLNSPVNSHNLLQFTQSLERHKQYLIKQMQNQKQLAKFHEKTLEGIAFKTAFDAQQELNRKKEIRDIKQKLGALYRVQYKVYDQMNLINTQNRDIGLALSTFREFHLKKAAKKDNKISFKSSLNLNQKYGYFKKQNFSFLDRMKDFQISRPKFLNKMMTVYAKTFKNFYYNNYKDFKGVFNRFVELWENHKFIQKSEKFFLKKNVPLRKFFYENFYHTGKLLQHYKHKLALHIGDKQIKFNSKEYGLSDQQFNNLQKDIQKLKLKFYSTNDIDALISLNATRTALEKFTSKTQFKTLKKFKYVFVDKLPDRHKLKFRGKLTIHSLKSERFVENLLNSKIKYKQALSNDTMMNFNLNTMPLTNSNIQIAKNIFKAALFYPQLNPFSRFIKHKKYNGKQGNLTVKDLTNVGQNILKKVKTKQFLQLSKKEQKFVKIVKKNQISKNELQKMFSGEMLNKKQALKFYGYKHGTIQAFKTLLKIAAIRKKQIYNKPQLLRKIRYKSTMASQYQKINHITKKLKLQSIKKQQIYKNMFKKIYNKSLLQIPTSKVKYFNQYMSNIDKNLGKIDNPNLKKSLLKFSANLFKIKLRYFNLLKAPFTSKNAKLSYKDLIKKYYYKTNRGNKNESFLKKIKKQYGLKAFKVVQSLSNSISKQQLKKKMNFINKLILGSIKEHGQFKKDLSQSLDQFQKLVFAEPPKAAERKSFTDSQFEFYDDIIKQKEIYLSRLQNDFRKIKIANQIPDEEKKKESGIVICCSCGCFVAKSNCCDHEYDNSNLYFLQEADKMININPKIYVNLFLEDQNGTVKKEQSIEIRPLKNKQEKPIHNELDQQELIQEQIEQPKKIELKSVKNLNKKNQPLKKKPKKQNKDSSTKKKQKKKENQKIPTETEQEPQQNISIANKIIKNEENEVYHNKPHIFKKYMKSTPNQQQKSDQADQPVNEVLEIDESELDKSYKQKIDRYHKLHIDDLDNIYKLEHMKDYYKKYLDDFMKNNNKIIDHQSNYQLDLQDDDETPDENSIANEFKKERQNMNLNNIVHAQNQSLHSLGSDFNNIYNDDILNDVSDLLKNQPKYNSRFVQENQYQLDNFDDKLDDYYQILDTKKKLIQL